MDCTKRVKRVYSIRPYCKCVPSLGPFLICPWIWALLVLINKPEWVHKRVLQPFAGDAWNLSGWQVGSSLTPWHIPLSSSIKWCWLWGSIMCDVIGSEVYLHHHLAMNGFFCGVMFSRWNQICYWYHWNNRQYCFYRVLCTCLFCKGFLTCMFRSCE